ncbi:hypothetical protein I553_9371 [Mycobacterium xenopi 4042]|uniref:Uncharacterized protein n=1 Tax=Mycobacterium xenopi 4042 TaxID=1299334 RepID=X8E059_MYCXE|nr:hypothetical protein I553_9371 [Mycobacterium xenopi 4042]
MASSPITGAFRRGVAVPAIGLIANSASTASMVLPQPTAYACGWSLTSAGLRHMAMPVPGRPGRRGRRRISLTHPGYTATGLPAQGR